jgi:hypothetical protein
VRRSPETDTYSVRVVALRWFESSPTDLGDNKMFRILLYFWRVLLVANVLCFLAGVIVNYPPAVLISLAMIVYCTPFAWKEFKCS